MLPTKIGRYTVESLIGHGGMGVVYLARDPHIERQVAIKLLHDPYLTEPKFKERFQREARIVARLDHPAIVPIYDFGEDNGRPYIVMRYMSGGSLREWIERDGLPVDVVVDLVKRIAPALDEAHREGVIHRDLKPSNILLDKRGEAYLSDFGIVKVSDASRSLTGSSVVGTPAYMSPEQGRNGADVDYRTDIYAVGVILFEMLTGRRPYEGESVVAQIVAHATEPIPDIRTYKRTLPDGIETVMNQALAKRPEDRFDSMSALVNALGVVTPLDFDKTELFGDLQTATGPVIAADRKNPVWYQIGLGFLFLTLLGLMIWTFLPSALRTDAVEPEGTQQGIMADSTAEDDLAPTESPPPLLTHPVQSTEAVVALVPATATATTPPTVRPTATEPSTQAATVTPLPSATEPPYEIVTLKPIDSDGVEQPNLGLNLGETTLLGVPFEHGWQVSTGCANAPDRPNEATLPLSNQDGTHIHLLLQAGQGFINYEGEEIGRFVVRFADGGSFETVLVLGENIRDWRLSTPNDLVTEVTSEDVREAWRGRSGNVDGRFDRLLLTLPQSQQGVPIVALELYDLSENLLGATDPCIHLLGITLENR